LFPARLSKPHIRTATSLGKSQSVAVCKSKGITQRAQREESTNRTEIKSNLDCRQGKVNLKELAPNLRGKYIYIVT
jgi:hypothetical protein